MTTERRCASDRPVVLHVVDRTSGGVPEAVRAYVANGPEGIRQVVMTPFPDGVVPRLWRASSAEVIELGDSPTRAIRSIRAAIRYFRPDIVHAHSSFSGVYARVASRKSARTMLYSPHCFAFERTDVPRLARRVFRLVEQVLARNTTKVVGCSSQEAELARRVLPSGPEFVWVPNVPSIDGVTVERRYLGVLRVAMLGRASPQKDPGYFVSALETLRAHGVACEGVWIGSGDDRVVNQLATAGVAVTGWLSSREVEQALGSADLYLHSAAWEGFPIAVLDAHASGLPVIVRSIDAFADVAEHLKFPNALDDLQQAVGSAAAFETWARNNADDWARFLALCDVEHQALMLEKVWRV